MYSSYWSAGIGWNIHNENFLKDSWVNLLRLKGSVGYVGNGNFSDIKPYTIYQYKVENRMPVRLVPSLFPWVTIC